MPNRRNTLLLMRGPLLNFHVEPFKILNPITGAWVEAYSAEHAFQAYKGLYLKGASRTGGETALEAFEFVLRAPTARDAKNRGRELDIFVPLWNRASFGHMVQTHIAKFSQLANLRETLLATGSKKLVEHRPDTTWGDNMDGTGKNLCGRSLMIVRRIARGME